MKNRNIEDLYKYATPEELCWLTTPVRDIYNYIIERGKNDELQDTEITTQSRTKEDKNNQCTD